MDQVPSISYKADPVAQEEPAILEDRPITPEASASPEVPASPEFRAAQKRGSPGSPVSEPPAKRAHIELEEKGCQTEEKIQKVDDLYKPEEKLDACTKEKTLFGVDLEELVRKRVELHSENFRHVCLPFNHSLDFKSWTQEEVLEMTFMGAVEVEGFKLAECDGKMIWNLTKEDFFIKLNETRAIFSWRALEKFINMLRQLETGLARNAAGYFQASSYRPSTPTEKIFEDIGIQVDPIETVVDKLNTQDLQVAVGGTRLEEMDLSENRIKRSGAAFNSLALPFNCSCEKEYNQKYFRPPEELYSNGELIPHFKPGNE
uniref:HSF_DOMAIN domain-containing protein n=1 Tax=Caenorhabditis tropicalis TaxID=1561998 RepID=A0A1I7UPR4_9PELO